MAIVIGFGFMAFFWIGYIIGGNDMRKYFKYKIKHGKRFRQ